MFDGKPSVFMADLSASRRQALETRDVVLGKMEDLAKDFPEGVDWEIGFDTTPYTRESIKEVFKAPARLGDSGGDRRALFLQNWRSSIIPLVAVPVAMVGTFAAMAMFGFSLNNLTLFGLVLAIGIVVDDAIVVVEAVEHNIEQGLARREATIRAMDQVSGPVIAVGLVLSAVFVPCAFISGITGQFFRQFAITISVSTIISAFNSLTLSPALTAMLLRPARQRGAPPLPWLAFALAGGWAGWARRSAGGPVGSRIRLASRCRRTGHGRCRRAGRRTIISWPRSTRFWAPRSGPSMARSARPGLVYTWGIGILLYASVLVLVAYGGLLALDLRQIHEHAQGVHSLTGYGLPANQRATARLGL